MFEEGSKNWGMGQKAIEIIVLEKFIIVLCVLTRKWNWDILLRQG